MNGRLRQAFTLIETVFVMAVASVVLVVLIQIWTGFAGGAEKGQQTLDFLRQATILLDYVRSDIRSAGRGDSVKVGKTATITREAPSASPDSVGPDQTITYEFNEEGRFVTRTVKGGAKEEEKKFGLSGATGFITNFEIASRHPRISVTTGGQTRDLDILGFYEVRLGFANEAQVKAMERGEKPKPVHNFRILVSKRAPEVTDDLWRPNPK